uniref:Amino acid transporter transmembrane domain-containing protein n=1 Tax=Zooxanthella nutricula TaxID=1333877 RepID=A0A6U6HZY8_9DINO|mmetsp:Transcript_16435/g.49030  ORF Transcript_16435/g.49030 Transcript_16435/m.49030 type:complete len:427 (+) Transcript_16435:51-1331(+)
MEIDGPGSGLKEADDDPPPSVGASVPQSVFNLTKSIAGTGLLCLPAGVAGGTGLFAAAVITVALGAFSGYTFSIYGRACAATGKQTIFELGAAAGGPLLANAASWACVVRTAFTCLANSIVIRDSLSKTFERFCLPAFLCHPKVVLFGTSGFVLLPLCLLRDLSALSYTSLLGILATMYTIVFMVMRWLDGSYGPGGPFPDASSKPVELAAHAGWSLNMSTWVLVCALSTSTSAHFNAPKYWDQLRHRSVRRFNKVILLSYCAVLALSITAMGAGYLTFGAASKGLILNSYSLNDPFAVAARIAVSASVVCTFPLTFTGLRDGVLSLIGAAPDQGPFLATTLALLATITALGMWIPNVDFVVNLGGAVFGALLTYIFPSLLLLRAGVRLDGAEAALAKASVAFGVLLGAVGTVVAILKEAAPGALR